MSGTAERCLEWSHSTHWNYRTPVRPAMQQRTEWSPRQIEEPRAGHLHNRRQCFAVWRPAAIRVWHTAESAKDTALTGRIALRLGGTRRKPEFVIMRILRGSIRPVRRKKIYRPPDTARTCVSWCPFSLRASAASGVLVRLSTHEIPQAAGYDRAAGTSGPARPYPEWPARARSLTEALPVMWRDRPGRPWRNARSVGVPM